MSRMKIVGRMRRHLLGRIVCRLLGDERGQAMMEYVIIAVLIAAAAVAAVAYFGKDIVAMFNVAGKAATGNATEAATGRGTAKTAAGGYAGAAVESNGKFSDVGDGKSGSGSTSGGTTGGTSGGSK